MYCSPTARATHRGVVTNDAGDDDAKDDVLEDFSMSPHSSPISLRPCWCLERSHAACHFSSPSVE